MRSQSLRGCAVATIAALALVSAAAAQGNSAYVGTTEQGTKVKLVADATGTPLAFKIAKTTADCEQGMLETEAATFRRFDTSESGTFSDKRKTKTQDGRYILKDVFVLSGTAAEDGSGWSGTYEKTTKVLKNRHRVDTCVLSATWEAS
jgi:hypothetical protein